VFVSQKIGKSKTNKICDFWAFDKKFQKLRSEIEEMMFRDHPSEARTNIFYGDKMYSRPTCRGCKSEQLSGTVASRYELLCLECGKVYYLAEGEPCKNGDSGASAKDKHSNE
jgi:hypothetical protein